MDILVTWFQEGGYAMFAVAVAGLFLLAFGIGFALTCRKWLGIAALVSMALAVGMGVAGTLHGRSLTDSAVGYADPAEADRLRSRGYHEAGHPLEFGAVVGGIGLVLITTGEVRLRLRKRRSEPS